MLKVFRMNSTDFIDINTLFAENPSDMLLMIWSNMHQNVSTRKISSGICGRSSADFSDAIYSFVKFVLLGSLYEQKHHLVVSVQ
jgi:hypothetical protein